MSNKTTLIAGNSAEHRKLMHNAARTMPELGVDTAASQPFMNTLTSFLTARRANIKDTAPSYDVVI